MMNIYCTIENLCDLQKHYTIRDGYIFTSITEPANIFDAIVIRFPETCDCHTPKVGFSNHSLQECIDLINKHKIKKALIIAEGIDFIKYCPSLECLEVIPANTAGNSFDYSPLYEMPEITELNCKTVYGNLEQFSTTIDYSKFKGLKKISICNIGHMNYFNVRTLESLRLANISKMADLQMVSPLCHLESLELIQCGIESLQGIESLKTLKRLDIGYCRKLQNLSALSYIGQTLNQLSIENCHKITNFDFLNHMTGLFRLALEGKNNLQDLSFLKQMSDLKELFLWMNVENGDITPCVGIPYVSLKNHKHYNMKDADLSKHRE